ncbi:MAG TPA: acyl-CoA dehydrogenase family protein [Solirubrobacteraceae bacterium]|nr:acyl-CoA dehydrogenase family protein [Solirubrobacteraceae bacterium]
MDLTYNEAELAFRDELRAWFSEQEIEPEEAGHDAEYARRLAFHRALVSGGWAAVDWPEEYGGRGATLMQSAIFYEELTRSGAPLPVNVLGILLAAPTIMRWGTPDQKDRFLHPILTAEEIWCQGFSEPDAGSDFASVKTRAVRDGDDWLITGQKVWTSEAQIAKWCMLVARTDPDVAKHKGLTFFLMDMEQEGVQVVPLRQMTGESEFNELFLDNVRVPAEHVLGGVGDGWKVALTTLMNERSGLGISLQVTLRQRLDGVIAAAAERGLLEDTAVAERLGELCQRTELLRLLAYRGLTSVEKYGQPGPEGSLTKWLWSDTNQQLTQCAADLLGTSALRAGSQPAYALLRSRGNSIEGGTTEILKNIIAERVLGLPKAR